MKSIDEVLNNQNLHSPKKIRITNLFLLLYNLKFSINKSNNINSFINNKRIIIDPLDEEDGDVSVLSFMNSKNELISDIPNEIKILIDKYNKGELDD